MRMTLRRHDDWPLEAKCQGKQDELFPDGADQKRVRSMCSGCRVRKECLAEALDNRIEWGVWGGMTERERRQLLRQRSDVDDWSFILLGKTSAVNEE
jgi:WhiB family redox-sensing transcriptional regulator